MNVSADKVRSMSKIDEIKAAVDGLSLDELRTLRAWLEDLEEQFVRQLLESCHDQRMGDRSFAWLDLYG